MATSNYQPMPDNLVLAGKDVDNSEIYIGRAPHDGDVLVAKVIPNRQYASVAYYGKEHTKVAYDVLTGQGFKWVKEGNGVVPRNAVEGGRTRTGELLYIGRVQHKGSLTPGKIHPGHQCLYIPFGGQELNFKSYEVLVHPGKCY